MGVREKMSSNRWSFNHRPFWGNLVHGYPWQSDWELSFHIYISRTLFWNFGCSVTIGYWRVDFGISLFKNEEEAEKIRGS